MNAKTQFKSAMRAVRAGEAISIHAVIGKREIWCFRMNARGEVVSHAPEQGFQRPIFFSQGA